MWSSANLTFHCENFVKNPIVIERENFTMLAGDMLLFWSFLVLKQLDLYKVLTVKCAKKYEDK